MTERLRLRLRMLVSGGRTSAIPINPRGWVSSQRYRMASDGDPSHRWLMMGDNGVLYISRDASRRVERDGVQRRVDMRTLSHGAWHGAVGDGILHLDFQDGTKLELVPW